MEPTSTTASRSRSTAVKAPSPAKPPDVGANHVALDRLLAMAHRYQRDGKVREAMELYWELAEDHPLTNEAAAAKAMLLELATNYERNGAPHMARSIYERLLVGVD